MKKNDSLHLRISTKSKENLKKKAENLGISLTSYVEKIANEPVIFIDGNVENLLKKMNSKYIAERRYKK